MLAVNVRLSMAYTHLREIDSSGAKSDNSYLRSILALYIFNIVAVCLLMVAFPYNLGFGGRLYGIVVPLWLLATAAMALRWMRLRSADAAIKATRTVFVQYVTAMIVLLSMVLISKDSYWVSVFSINF